MPKKILIVDDEKLITETLAGMLKFAGYEISEAFDGESAIKFLKDSTPDLVVLDMKLPGIDGIEVLRTIRQSYPDTFVVVMTGYDVEYKKKVDQIGAEGFFVKPILVEALKEKIEEIFSAKSPKTPTAKESLLSTEKTPAQPREAISEAEIIPKARILLIEPREMLTDFLDSVLSSEECCEAEYEIKNWTGMLEGADHSELIRHFKPDIVLFDVAMVGMFGEFAVSLMKLPSPPKEIILFGDPETKMEDTDVIIKRGTIYIPTPLDRDKYDLPHREIMEKLLNTLKSVCIKHGLFYKKGKMNQP